MVETAFVLFILILFAFGITEFGRAMYTKNMLNNAARAGARRAVVTPTLSLSTTYSAGSFTGDCSAMTDPVEQQICQSLMYVDKANVSAQLTVTKAPGNSGATSQTNDTVDVAVTVNGFTSFIPHLFGPNAIPFPSSLTGEATMRYE